MPTRIYKPFVKGKPAASIDLAGHHALCEINYHRTLMLTPGLMEARKTGHDESLELAWLLGVGYPQSNWSMKVNIKVLEAAPYTTTFEISQTILPDNPLEKPPRLVVRLYHDVGMAEIISWDNHRHWQPRYQYPNPQMYQPDEKLALNSFLGDWLKFCCGRAVQM